MALLLSTVKRTSLKGLEEKFLSLTLSVSNIQVREKTEKSILFPAHINAKPRLRHPTWLPRKNRIIHEDYVTSENREFLKEVVQDKLQIQNSTPLISAQDSIIEWTPRLTRPGVIARKIGIYPMWTKNGKKISTTLLQVLDNHVIKYYSPEEYKSPRERSVEIVSKKACLLIGAEATDPALLTKEYCNLFKGSGVVPKKYLSRFFVSPEAALSPGTPLNALHFQIGNYVDVRGKTIDRGFQGVMKRHGFKGMPASHGVTKTHRRGGNIGGGGEKGRVWPGTKMPGHMGNRYRMLKGLKILRINTKYNVLFVSGQAIPGETNAIVTIYDTILPLRKPTKPIPFPTYFNIDEPVPEELFSDEIHMFSDPTIEFNET